MIPKKTCSGSFETTTYEEKGRHHTTPPSSTTPAQISSHCSSPRVGSSTMMLPGNSWLVVEEHERLPFTRKIERLFCPMLYLSCCCGRWCDVGGSAGVESPSRRLSECLSCCLCRCFCPTPHCCVAPRLLPAVRTLPAVRARWFVPRTFPICAPKKEGLRTGSPPTTPGVLRRSIDRRSTPPRQQQERCLAAYPPPVGTIWFNDSRHEERSADHAPWVRGGSRRRKSFRGVWRHF